MKKNRILGLVMTLALCVGLFAGCGSSKTDYPVEKEANAVDIKQEKGTEKTEDKISIVCTTFPQYDWVREVIGDQKDQFDLTLLLDDGVDLHSYQPTAEDIAKISSSDIFIYVGGESDGWVEDALEEATNPDLKAINMMEVLGDTVKEEEIVEGMQAEEEEEAEEGEEEPEYDEHVWLSLKNAKVLVENISDTIQAVDTENAQSYKENASAYLEKLNQLDSQYEETVQNANVKTVVFGDRFPFRYLVDDYKLNYYAAFVGCSAETEASFETITFLAKKVDELGLNTILTIENSNHEIAENIKQNTEKKNQNILSMNSLQSVTNADLDGGFTYLKAMQDNLEVLKQALN
ncbi:zinc ABC transporter substrate-binding protein [Roseburia hominis]|uniref:metal ABC transporter substrate-binding protein n=1 Tax=Roseburia hominis TaxID=301301 RepID=UPI001F3887A0|nr:zinc ABC transporter substrate-binding protein [Roseburia hominis]